MACDSSCLTCTSKSSCTSCPVLKLLVNGSCVAYCGDAYYPAQTTSVGNTCLQCNTSCNTCVDSPTKCTSCTNYYYLSTDTCLGNLNTFLACDETCLTCSGSLDNQCLTCPTYYYLNQNNYCKGCGDFCLTCNGPGFIN
jgi:proprotein convertase subtilisin/kexin type 5